MIQYIGDFRKPSSNTFESDLNTASPLLPPAPSYDNYIESDDPDSNYLLHALLETNGNENGVSKSSESNEKTDEDRRRCFELYHKVLSLCPARLQGMPDGLTGYKIINWPLQVTLQRRHWTEKDEELIREALPRMVCTNAEYGRNLSYYFRQREIMRVMQELFRIQPNTSYRHVHWFDCNVYGWP